MNNALKTFFSFNGRGGPITPSILELLRELYSWVVKSEGRRAVIPMNLQEQAGGTLSIHAMEL